VPARAYSASGLSHPGALPRLISTCLIAAILGGVIEGIVSRWFSLLLLFPAFLGLIVGGTAIRVIEKAHVRAPLLAALIAGVAGLLGEATLQGVQYYQFRSGMLDEIASEAGARADSVIDGELQQQTGHGGIVGYLLLRARVGTEVKKAGHSTGLKLAGTAFWVLFALNFSIVAGIAAAMAWDRARAPYCEGCQRWYDRTEDVASGAADKASVAATLQALTRGAYGDVPGVFGSAAADSGSLLRLLRCGSCNGHEPQLSYTVVTGIGKKPKTKKAFTTLLRPEDAKLLAGAFEKKS
jgi:hypothetical protein